MNATTTTRTVRVTSKDFPYSLAFLKKRGYAFDPFTRTWSGAGDIQFLIEGGYVVEIRYAGR